MDTMDPDEQELQDIQEQFMRAITASQDEERQRIDREFTLCTDLIQGASAKQKKLLWKQYYQKKEAILRDVMQRNREIMATHAQQMKDLEDRVHVQATLSDAVYPFWHISVTGITEEAPSHFKLFFAQGTDIYSLEGLRDFLRFFLDNPKETMRSGPIELEIIRVTHKEAVFSLKGIEVTDRAVYHVDFRLPQRRDLIGHNHVQNEVIGVWVTLGGQFIHRVTQYNDQGLAIRMRDRKHRPIPKEYTD